MTDVMKKISDAIVDEIDDQTKGDFSEAVSILNFDAITCAALDALAESVSPEMVSAARVSWNTPFHLTGDGQPGDPMRRMIEAAIRASILAAKTEG